VNWYQQSDAADTDSVATLTASAAQIQEAGGAIVVTATLSTILTSPVWVRLYFSGAARINADLTASASEILIPAGQRSGSITLTAIDDSIYEGNEALLVGVAEVIGPATASPEPLNLTLLDNDPISSVSFSVSTPSIAEADGKSRLIATLSAASGRDTIVGLRLSGTADFGTDYRVDGSTVPMQFVIPAGQTSASMEFVGLDDTKVEGAETIAVTIESTSNAVNATTGNLIIGIRDDDMPPYVVDSQVTADGTAIRLRLSRMLSTSGLQTSHWGVTRSLTALPVSISTVTQTSEAGTGLAVVVVTFSRPLEPGDYLLRAKRSITDTAGRPLNGHVTGADGADYVERFGFATGSQSGALPTITGVSVDATRQKIVVAFAQAMNATPSIDSSSTDALLATGTVLRVADPNRPGLFTAPNWGLRLPGGRYIMQPTEYDDPRATPEQFGDITFGYNATSDRWEASIAITRDGQPLTLEPGTYTLIARGTMTDAAGRKLHPDGGFTSLSFTLDPPPVITAVTSDLGLRNAAVSTVTVDVGQPIVPGSLGSGSVSLERDGQPVDLTKATLTFTPVAGSSTQWQVAGLAGVTTADGVYTLTILPTGIVGTNGLAAMGSAGIGWRMDKTTPVAKFEEIAENRVTPLTGLTIGFAEPVTGLQLSDFSLTRDGVAVPLTGVTLDVKRRAFPIDFVSTDSGKSLVPADVAAGGRASTVLIGTNVPAANLPTGSGPGSVFRYVGTTKRDNVSLATENYRDTARWAVETTTYVVEYALGGLALADLTAVHGSYVLRLKARAGIVDQAGNGIAADAVASWAMDTSVKVYTNETYTLAGSLVPAGPAKLVKREAGTLVVDKANTFSGGTDVEAGLVVAKSETALGTGPLTIGSGGTLKVELASGLLRASKLSLGSTGRINVGSRGLRIAAGGYDSAALQQAIAAGRITAESAGQPRAVSLQVESPSGDAIVAFNLTTVPGIPTNLLSTPGNGQVSLAWTAPATNGGATIADYEIQYSSNSGGSWTTFSDGTSASTSTTVTGLTNGTAYIFKVRAVNSAGSGNFSANSSPVTPVLPVTAPTAPTRLTVPAKSATDTTVALSWTAPANSGGAPLTGYYIQVATDAGFTKVVQDYRPTTTSQTVTGLTANVPYYFRIMATNGVHWGAYSATAVRLVQPTAPTAVTVPVGPGTATSVALSWTAPASSGGGTIAGYYIQVATDRGFTKVVQEYRPASNTQLVTGLTANVPYYFRIMANNGIHWGAYSATAARLLQPTAPTALTVPPGPSTATSLTLSWTAPANNGGAPITGYFVQVATDSSFTKIVQEYRPTSTTAAVTGLKADVPYYFRVMAANGVHWGAYSATAARLVQPTPPTSLTLPATKGTDDSSVVLSWTAPADSGGGPITGYYVQVATDSGFTKGLKEYRPSTTTQTVTGLTPGVPSYFRVMAANGVCWSGFSATAMRLAPPIKVTVPGGPSTATSVALSWTAPANNGGGTITGYSVQVATDANFTTVVQEYKPVGNTQTVTGLTPNVPYYFRVAATSGSQNGSFSATATRLIPPTAPLSLTVPAGASTDTTVALSWKAPTDGGGGTITGYYVQVATDAGFTKVVQEYRPVSSTQLVTGLTANVPYYFRVMATNGVCWGGYSTTAVRLVRPTAPLGVTVPAGPSTATSVALTWSAPANTGGGPIAGYYVQVATDSGFAKVVQEYRPVSSAQLVTGLTSNVFYYFRVMANNGVHWGPYSATAARLVPPSAPTGLTVPAGQVTDTSVALSWKAPADAGGGTITGYYVQVATDSGFTKVVQDYRPSTTSQTVTGLTANVPYYFRVAAANAVHWGGYSATAARLVQPSAPTAVNTAAGPTANSVTVSWTAPTNTGGASAITGYFLQTSEDSSFATFDEVWVTGTSHTVTGLTSKKTYFFRVMASNGVQSGAPSTAASRTV